MTPHLALGTVASAYHAAGGGGNPVNTVAPVATIDENFFIDTTNGTWTGTPTITFTYEWQANDSDPDDAGAWYYYWNQKTTGIEQFGYFRCKVTATNGISPDGVAYSNVLEVF